MVLRLKTWESRSPPGPPTTRTQARSRPSKPVTCSRHMPIQHPDAGWSSPVARQAHNLKVAGSNPAPATKSARPAKSPAGFLLFTEPLGLLAYDLAGADAGAVLGTALAIKMVAYVGVAPVVGAFADRLPRRAFLVAMDLVRAAIALCLPFVTEVWQVYVLVFVLQS